MKLKKVRIIVESIEETNKRWAKALSGKLAPKSNEEVIVVSSWDQLGQVFSSQRLQILSVIPDLKPKSISELARVLKRDFKNVYNDVRLLADLGLITLKEEGRRKTLVPIAKFNDLSLPLAG
jgi:predicted transcriptional regulator